MKEYTDHFDSGNTHLFTGKCVSKDSPLIEAVGAVDELNSILGMATTQIKDNEIVELLRGVQGDLLTIGADLASPGKKQKALDPAYSRIFELTKELTEKEVKKMEELMERYEKELPLLRNFILPSGAQGAATLQMARAITRRVERRIVAAKVEEVNFQILKYFNRLSDFLFTLSRLVNQREGGKEHVWNERKLGSE